MKTKICTKCGKRKPLSGFYNDRTKKDGLKTYCKDCANEMNNSYRKAEREKAQRLESSKKRLAESKKAFKKAVEEEVDAGKLKQSLAPVVLVSKLIGAVVKTMADVIGVDADVIVKLKSKKK